jgi:tight adherence protein B
VVLSLGAPAAAQEVPGSSQLRIEHADATDFPTIRLLITPPPELYGIQPEAATLDVIENGERRPASVRILTDRPLRVLLAIDTSGSMSGDALAQAKAAAIGFVAAMPPTTEFSVLGFGPERTDPLPFTSDRDAVTREIGRLEAFGETTMFDAVIDAVTHFATANGSISRPFVVLLSDGGDTRSAATVEDAASSLAGTDIGFYAVALETGETDLEALEHLAADTAGRVALAADTEALTDVYATIAGELTNQLVVTYTTASGGRTKLAVTIAEAGLEVRADAAFTLPTLPAPEPRDPASVAPDDPEPVTPTTVKSRYVPPTTLPPETLTPSAATPWVNDGAGALGRGWAMPIGIAALALTLVIGFVFFFVSDRPVRTLAATQSAATSAGGVLGATARRGRAFFEDALRRAGRLQALGSLLESAGMTMAPGEFLVAVTSAAIVGFAVGFLFGPWIGLAGIAVGSIVPFLYAINRRDTRQAAFGEQLESTLQLIAGNLRAGYGLMQAIGTVASEADEPTAAEFSRIVVETRLGRDLIDSMHAVADRVGNEDYEWVVQAIEIQRSVGGDLAEVLDTVGATIRERNQLRRQVKALSAEGRVSGYVLVALPFFLTVTITLTNPGFLQPLVETTVGRAAIGIGLLLMGVGVVWIRRIIKLRF